MKAGGNYTYCSEHLVMHIINESLHCTSEANIILYVNYITREKGEI